MKRALIIVCLAFTALLPLNRSAGATSEECWPNCNKRSAPWRTPAPPVIPTPPDTPPADPTQQKESLPAPPPPPPPPPEPVKRSIYLHFVPADGSITLTANEVPIPVTNGKAGISITDGALSLVAHRELDGVQWEYRDKRQISGDVAGTIKWCTASEQQEVCAPATTQKETYQARKVVGSAQAEEQLSCPFDHAEYERRGRHRSLANAACARKWPGSRSSPTSKVETNSDCPGNCDPRRGVCVITVDAPQCITEETRTRDVPVPGACKTQTHIIACQEHEVSWTSQGE